jgi:hypothetical protein
MYLPLARDGLDVPLNLMNHPNRTTVTQAQIGVYLNTGEWI